MMRPRTGTAAAVLLAFHLLVGCTKACNSVGASSGVTFDVRRIIAGQTGHVHVRACVERSCVSRIASPTRWNHIPVADPDINGPRSVSVHLTITDMNSRSVYDGTAEVQLHTLQPTGLPAHRLRGGSRDDGGRTASQLPRP